MQSHADEDIPISDFCLPEGAALPLYIRGGAVPVSLLSHGKTDFHEERVVVNACRALQVLLLNYAAELHLEALDILFGGAVTLRIRDQARASHLVD